MVISAHLIIPHDHHSSDLSGNRDDSCPVSENKPVHNHGFPTHCHAFNDLASEKIIKYIVSKNIQFHDLSICGFSNIVIFQLFEVTSSDYTQSFIEPQSPDLSQLRAPPFSS
jgi:hypothetical protein